MSVTRIESIVERLQHSANVRSVFGEPVERGDRTVVPVARVSYGFGGGFGQSDGGNNGGDGDGGGGDGESGDQRAIGGRVGSRVGGVGSGGGGGGGGGGASATPVGALEITDEGTRFVRIESRKRSAAAALLAGVAVGLLVGRRSGRR